MKKLMWGLSYLFCMYGLPSIGQHNIALLNMPIRELPDMRVQTNEQVQLKFQLVDRMIYVNGKLEQESGAFIFDTGAPTLVLNEKIPAHEFSTGFTAYSCAGEVKVGVRNVSSFLWAGQSHQHLEALIVDMSHLGNTQETPRGLIGYELFKSQVLCLDYKASRLVLLSNEQWKKMRRGIQPLASFPLTLYGHLPVIKLAHQGKVMHFGIDTGAATNLISPESLPVFEYEISAHAREELQGLDQQIQVVDAVDLNLWDNQFAAHHFLVVNLSTLNVDNDWELDGLLGYEFLSRYRVVIDYPNQELSIWPL